MTVVFTKDAEEYFRSLKVVIPLYPEGSTREFRSINRFYEFIEKEIEYWSYFENSRASSIINQFHAIRSRLNEASNSALNVDQKTGYILQAVNLAMVNNVSCMYSITVAAQKMKTMYDRDPACADAFYDYLNNASFDHLPNQNYFYGALQSFNVFDSKADSNTVKEKELQLTELSKRFSEELNVLDKDSDEFKKKILGWKEELVSGLDSYVESRREALDTLETTYNENLRLKSPADYWKLLSEEYEKKGDHWRTWCLWVGGVSLGLMTAILFRLPSELANLQSLSFTSFKSILILAVIVSIDVYIIRLFVKLATSSYHLSRDAKERFQLTYFYLSLVNEKDVSASERSIVYNALFSRADTGLLKGDSGPTIPEGSIQQIIKMMKSTT